MPEANILLVEIIHQRMRAIHRFLGDHGQEFVTVLAGLCRCGVPSGVTFTNLDAAGMKWVVDEVAYLRTSESLVMRLKADCGSTEKRKLALLGATVDRMHILENRLKLAIDVPLFLERFKDFDVADQNRFSIEHKAAAALLPRSNRRIRGDSRQTVVAAMPAIPANQDVIVDRYIPKECKACPCFDFDLYTSGTASKPSEVKKCTGQGCPAD